MQVNMEFQNNTHPLMGISAQCLLFRALILRNALCSCSWDTSGMRDLGVGSHVLACLYFDFDFTKSSDTMSDNLLID